MVDNGFALYKRDGDLYLMPVAYEYNDTKFVGFQNVGYVYKINKINDKQREWLKHNDPQAHPKAKLCIFFANYYICKVFLKDFPKGKMYTQLPGGGGVYKETRKCNYVEQLFSNSTFLKAVENHGVFNETMQFISKTIKSVLEETVFLKKCEIKTWFTAVLIEDADEINKINKIFNHLFLKGFIPSDFQRPMFSNGQLDYHMTVKMGELPIMFKRDLNKDVFLNIKTVGISDEAIALGVSGDYFSTNKFQHITIAFKDVPSKSNEIQSWVKLKRPLKISGVLREFDNSKEIIKRGVFDENQIQIGNFQSQGASFGKSSFFPKEQQF